MRNIIQDTEAYRAIEREYMATLRQYRAKFGLADSLKINDMLTLGAWQSDPVIGRVGRLIDRMKMELAQEDEK